MSPSESELRSFLRTGEGDRVDPDALIAHARGVRHNRRVRLASVAAAVIAVGTVGAGAVALGAGNSGSPSADRNALGKSATPSEIGAPTRPAAPAPAPSGFSERSDAGVCPSLPLRLMLPGGGGTGQFGGDQPLFDGSVTSMRICGYAPAGLTAQVKYSSTTVLTAPAANEIAMSLNAAPTTREIRPCPLRQTRELIIYAKTAAGASLKPVVVDYSSCAPFATNGTAARYDWVPPKGVAPLLSALMTPDPDAPSSPGGKSFEPSGSPVR